MKHSVHPVVQKLGRTNMKKEYPEKAVRIPANSKIAKSWEP